MRITLIIFLIEGFLEANNAIAQIKSCKPLPQSYLAIDKITKELS